MSRIVFLHPDLGIGGAERLVVDAALALKRKGHTARFFTAHHSRNHAFPETTDGQLSVTCVGDWLPRSTLGYLAAFWAYIRMIYVAIYLVFFSEVNYDIAFVDQISACIPFLLFKRNTKIIFYCHFPDLLLTERKSILKRVYRYFIDLLEEYTTRMADCVLVNSKFTAEVFKNTFKSIRITPSVLYPSLDFTKFDEMVTLPLSDVGVNTDADFIFLSLNRYERKKNISLALVAFRDVLNTANNEDKDNIHLVIAGGYDHRVTENIEHYKELVNLANTLNIMDKITFLKSPTDDAKVTLLRLSTCLLYTPDNEHFGIVPIEAMYVRTPVIAVNSGGPRETIVNNETGFLCQKIAEDFSRAMLSFIDGRSSKVFMGKNAHERVKAKFSFAKFSEHLDYVINSLVDERKQN